MVVLQKTKIVLFLLIKSAKFKLNLLNTFYKVFY